MNICKVEQVYVLINKPEFMDLFLGYDNSSNFLWIGLAAGQPSGLMSSNQVIYTIF